MSDELFHCVCRSCETEQVVETVTERGRFFDTHADHAVRTTAIETDPDPEPEGRIIECRASD